MDGAIDRCTEHWTAAHHSQGPWAPWLLSPVLRGGPWSGSVDGCGSGRSAPSVVGLGRCPAVCPATEFPCVSWAHTARARDAGWHHPQSKEETQPHRLSGGHGSRRAGFRISGGAGGPLSCPPGHGVPVPGVDGPPDPSVDGGGVSAGASASGIDSHLPPSSPCPCPEARCCPAPSRGLSFRNAPTRVARQELCEAPAWSGWPPSGPTRGRFPSGGPALTHPRSSVRLPLASWEPGRGR